MPLAHETIEYVLIYPTGDESRRTGLIWALAPTTPRGRAFWVVPDDPYDADQSDGVDVRAPTSWPGPAPDWLIDLVVVVSRRHRVGRFVTTPAPVTPRRPIPLVRRFGPQAGRWVDKGTRYAELHPEGHVNAAAARQGAAMATRRYAASDDRPVTDYWPTFASLASGV